MSTICAIATPAAVGGISVIRLSGERSLEIAAAVFRPLSGADVRQMRGYRACYGSICDGGELLDDGVLLVYRAPHSYTGEDAAEISCHGGIYVTRRVLAACIKAGAEPAAAGEFTKRALLNGKMSLTQAEAVTDIIAAQGEQQLACSNAQRGGALYRRIERISDMIRDICAHISAWIDFPDDDTPVVTTEWLAERVDTARQELSRLLDGYDVGRLIREGVSCAIVGRPNAGKSTLMNLLTGTRRSIVSDTEGTTRDIVEETVNLCGMVLRLADCAGLRDTADNVERIGVELMLERLRDADIVIALFDGSQELCDDDRRLFSLTEGKRVVCVLNKSDLPQKADISELKRVYGDVVAVCAKEESALEAIGAALREKIRPDTLSPDAGFLANERQRSCALKAAEALGAAAEAVAAGLTPDVVSVALEQALSALSELSGKSASEDVIAAVFEKFCVGK